MSFHLNTTLGKKGYCFTDKEINLGYEMKIGIGFLGTFILL
jgi:hypothetical protein